MKLDVFKVTWSSFLDEHFLDDTVYSQINKST